MLMPFSPTHLLNEMFKQDSKLKKAEPLMSMSVTAAQAIVTLVNRGISNEAWLQIYRSYEAIRARADMDAVTRGGPTTE